MNSMFSRCLAGPRRFASALLRAVRRACSALVELNRQLNRVATIQMSQDVYMIRPDVGPDTYAEFLSRTRGRLRHEPSARARLDGHPVH
jgi:hypothetical protein